MNRRTLLANGLLLILLVGTAAAETTLISLEDDQYISGEFSLERRLNHFEAPLRSHGRFILSAEHGLLWQTEVPVKQTLILSGRSLSRLTADGEVEALTSDSDRVGQYTQLINKLLNGDWSAIESRFHLEDSGSDTDRWHKTLTPDEQGALFQRIEISGGRFVERLSIHKGSQNRDRIEFSDQSLHDGPLPEDIRTLFTATGS
ncbi:hypothetical protein J2T55_000355 [Methylohalomonas lacus]|uniref:Outer membrane lipoprotein carrier protein LolA n=1 Tax=Methylohalomonas lacus TaxID=398773 RepID=A0AAE3HHH6_9GAMM|nr:outer membrane lipoprotein carrier protein LolA [Methylohalomonas lacus]MCS3902359.1 hypothetical protein [Methylohalomonas lacus]